MLNQIVNRLRGQVHVRVEAAFPERVLNLCGARNLSFWDLEWEGETAFTCRLSRRDWHILRRAARQMDCVLTPVRQEGVPYFVGRFRRRHALLAGMALSAAALFFGSFFIWDFSVEGNETVAEEVILRALQKNGVGMGTFGFSLDAEDIRNHVLLEVPELSWITVNVSGCRAYVQVRERKPAPRLVSKRAPSNVVARRDGLVLEVQALDGVKCVLPGTAVERGQLLISGVEDLETAGTRMLAGMGTVQARTWHTYTTVMPLKAQVKRYTGEERVRRGLVIGTRRVNFFPNSSIEGRNYDKIATRRPWSLLGLPLPVTSVKEVYRFYETEERELDPIRMEEAGERLLTAYLHTRVDPYGSVRSALCAARRRGEGLEVTVQAECREEIGESVPIFTEESGG